MRLAETTEINHRTRSQYSEKQQVGLDEPSMTLLMPSNVLCGELLNYHNINKLQTREK